MFVDHNRELIARELGITVEELGQLHYEEGSEEDDGVIHTYYMRFSDENPWRIMVKIKGLQGSTLRLNPSSKARTRKNIRKINLIRMCPEISRVPHRRS